MPSSSPRPHQKNHDEATKGPGRTAVNDRFANMMSLYRVVKNACKTRFPSEMPPLRDTIYHHETHCEREGRLSIPKTTSQTHQATFSRRNYLTSSGALFRYSSSSPVAPSRSLPSPASAPGYAHREYRHSLTVFPFILPPQ